MTFSKPVFRGFELPCTCKSCYPYLDSGGGEVGDGLPDPVLQLVLDRRRPQQRQVLLDDVVARVELLLAVLQRDSHLRLSNAVSSGLRYHSDLYRLRHHLVNTVGLD